MAKHNPIKWNKSGILSMFFKIILFDINQNYIHSKASTITKSGIKVVDRNVDTEMVLGG
jgi:hypothetical protein